MPFVKKNIARITLSFYYLRSVNVERLLKGYLKRVGPEGQTLTQQALSRHNTANNDKHAS